MNNRRFRVRRAVFLWALPVLLFAPATCVAHPGGFWYGLYNVQHGPNSLWGDTVWCAMSHTYHMNWALTGINEADLTQHALDSAKAAGIGIMQSAVREPGPDTWNDSALIFWRYSNAAHLVFQAEGDTILYEWEPSDACGGKVGVFVRHNASGGGMAVVDHAASRDSAWQFDPARSSLKDSIWVDFSGLGRNPKARSFLFPYRIRAQAAGCTGELAHLTLRKDTSKVSCVQQFVTFKDTSLTCASFADTNYHTVELSFSPTSDGDEWNLRLVLEWTGKAKLWIDWLGVRDDAGGELIAQPGITNSRILAYANRYSYGGDPGVLGFYMMEELFQDANVYPQFRVDSLLQYAAGNLTPFTEHNELSWWADRQMFGGRNAASARMEYRTPVSACFYPYDGYHFENVRQKSYPYAASVETVLAVIGTASCQPNDTAICLQTQVDAFASQLNSHKRMSVSTSKKFMPFLQTYSYLERLKPKDCDGDTNPPWQVGKREPTENETKLEASIALAHGANGLLYYRWSDAHYYEYIDLDCHGSTIPWQQKRNYYGLVSLPGVRNALHGYVGLLLIHA